MLNRLSVLSPDGKTGLYGLLGHMKEVAVWPESNKVMNLQTIGKACFNLISSIIPFSGSTRDGLSQYKIQGISSDMITVMMWQSNMGRICIRHRKTLGSYEVTAHFTELLHLHLKMLNMCKENVSWFPSSYTVYQDAWVSSQLRWHRFRKHDGEETSENELREKFR